jgi:FkbM family methyltransferase
LANFFGLENKMPTQLYNENMKQTNWIVFAFEANPLFTETLFELKNDLTQLKHTINLFNGTAAWTRNGYIDFYLDLVNKRTHFWGSSIKETHPDVVHSGKKKITVPCVDIADIVDKFNVEDFLFLKIDIEGAEYELLIHLLQRNLLRKIDYVAIEYHPSAMNIWTAEDAFNFILKLTGTKHIKWS